MPDGVDEAFDVGEDSFDVFEKGDDEVHHFFGDVEDPGPEVWEAFQGDEGFAEQADDEADQPAHRDHDQGYDGFDDGADDLEDDHRHPLDHRDHYPGDHLDEDVDDLAEPPHRVPPGVFFTLLLLFGYPFFDRLLDVFFDLFLRFVADFLEGRGEPVDRVRDLFGQRSPRFATGAHRRLPNA